MAKAVPLRPVGWCCAAGSITKQMGRKSCAHRGRKNEAVSSLCYVAVVRMHEEDGRLTFLMCFMSPSLATSEEVFSMLLVLCCPLQRK